MTMLARLRPPTATHLAILAAALFTLPQTGCSKNAPDADGWITLFDGETLDGWKKFAPLGNPAASDSWKVENGVIVGRQVQPFVHGSGTMLMTERPFKNFELEFDVKPDWDISSGVGLRTNPTGRSIRVSIDYRDEGTVGHLHGFGVGDFDTRTFTIALDKGAKGTVEKLTALNISSVPSEETRLVYAAKDSLTRRLTLKDERIKEFEKLMPLESRPNSDGLTLGDIKLVEAQKSMLAAESALIDVLTLTSVVEQARKDNKPAEAILLLLTKHARREADSRKSKEDKSPPLTLEQHMEELALERQLLEERRTALLASLDAIKKEAAHLRKFNNELESLKRDRAGDQKLFESVIENFNQILSRSNTKRQTPGVAYACDASVWLQHWKLNNWNQFRVVVEGSPAKISTWLNGEKVVAWDGAKYEDRNYEAARVVENLGDEGFISLQVDGHLRWPEGSACRWRNIRVRELK